VKRDRNIPAWAVEGDSFNQQADQPNLLLGWHRVPDFVEATKGSRDLIAIDGATFQCGLITGDLFLSRCSYLNSSLNLS